ncbi:MAG TPA: hypothetical protein VD996_02310 [Chitinophagaceae bacterium]|nr:hypothetical protein [Chitinophagaceae bacterium]
MQEKNVSDVVADVGYEKIYVHESGGIVWRHRLVEVNGIDYDEVFEVAVDKAMMGCEVHILPILPEDDPLRKIVFANAKDRKCPDLKIDGVYTEIKTPHGELHQNKISNNIKYAHEQADNIILRLNQDFDIQILLRIVKGRFKSHDLLNKIKFKMNGIYYTFQRKDLV